MSTTAPALIFLELFGETISYTPAGGDARSITAILDREPPKKLDTGDAPRKTIKVQVANLDNTQGPLGSADGIAATTIDVGGDTLSLARIYGRSPETVHVVRIADQDAHMLTLEVA